ncbi:hypothetical protein HPO96_03740 [Kribbella sandramycini]|uniref:Uncharacterized protein n=1 Tax=Kribbella sandramycini TaxID=60450 RepID=A0A7Y4NXD6_9ACTN|nr:hypothetical protein [Kribbella sandramycini]MBB6568055.1 hypothetical protein [Kribbella sandramycini]NOL39351.1 hypothetical protein [Kribbella sandramycini]
MDAVLVVTAMPLSEAARSELSDTLGDGYLVVDIKEAPPTANILLTPVVSGQLLGSLRAMFPEARILFTELHDDGHGISLEGPLARIVARGPDGYYVADALEALAPVVQSESRLQLTGSSRRNPPRLALAAPTPVDSAIAAPAESAGIIWLTSPAAPPGRALDLHAIDNLVAQVLNTATPRDDLLWAAIAVECALRLLSSGEGNVLIDVTDLPAPVLAELQIRVMSESVPHMSWPPDATPRR